MSESPDLAPSASYLHAIRRHKKLCLLGPLVLAVAAYLLGYILPKRYRSEATVVVNRISITGYPVSATELPLGSIVNWFKDRTIMDRVHEQFELAERCKVGADTFAGALLTVGARPRDNTIVIVAELPQAQLAADVATAVAEYGRDKYLQDMTQQYDAMSARLLDRDALAEAEYTQAEGLLEELKTEKHIEVLTGQVENWRELRQEREVDLIQLDSRLKLLEGRIRTYSQQWEKIAPAVATGEPPVDEDPQLRRSLKELEAVEAGLAAFHQAHKLETLRSKIDVLQGTRARYQSRRESINVALQADREMIAELRRAIEGEPGVIELSRKLVDNPAFQQIFSRLSGKAQEELAGLELSESVLNPVHVYLNELLLRKTVEEKRLLGELAAMDGAEQINNKRLAGSQDELIAAERILEDLQRRREVLLARFEKMVAAAAAGRINLESLQLEALHELAEARKEKLLLDEEAEIRRALLAQADETLKALEGDLFKAERALSELTFDRDKKQEASRVVSEELAKQQSIPVWPPQQVLLIRAPVPDRPYWPRKGLMAVVTLIGSFLLLWTLAVYLDSVARKGPH